MGKQFVTKFLYLGKIVKLFYKIINKLFSIILFDVKFMN